MGSEWLAANFQVDDLLARMPVDAGDLNEVVKSIRVLKENGGSESDIAGMIAATKPLAEKVETWGGQALVSCWNYSLPLCGSFLLWLNMTVLVWTARARPT